MVRFKVMAKGIRQGLGFGGRFSLIRGPVVLSEDMIVGDMKKPCACAGFWYSLGGSFRWIHGFRG